MKYRTIVVDPPWRVNTGPSWGSDPDKLHPINSKSHGLIYPTMTVDAIKSLPIGDLAEQSAHLYIWTINKYVEDVYAIARTWGFRPFTLLTWVKKPKGIGLGGAFALSSEFVLFARRGSLHDLNRIDRNWWLWDRRRHSQKPDEFLDIVESVSAGPYLEMFARSYREGWDCWGNEVQSIKTGMRQASVKKIRI